MVKFKDQSIFSAFNEKTKIFQEKIYEHALNNEWMSDPYIGFRLKELEKKIDNELILKTNSLGLRAEEFKRDSIYDVLFLGGSLVFGSYSSNQRTTISEFYSKKTAEKVLNGGIGGHVLKQHFSLYFNYLSKITFKKIIIIFGFNDMTNCYQGKTFNDIRLDIFHKHIDSIYKNPSKELLKIILSKSFNFLTLNKLKKLFYDFRNNLSNNHIKYSEITVNNYCYEIDKALVLFKNFCKDNKIDMYIILQPSLTTSIKKKKFV